MAAAKKTNTSTSAKSGKYVAWSGLAQRALDALPPQQKRSAVDGVIKMANAPSTADRRLVPLPGTGKFVMSVSNDKVRVVAERVATGWKVVDVSRPAGGFSFAPLPKTTQTKLAAVKAAKRR